MVIVLVWWAISARKWFKGPKVNVDHLMLGREDGNVIQGEGAQRSSQGDASSSDGPYASEKVPEKTTLA